ncbi:UNVERIFIED_CONTAM: hypothetical protein Slati_1725400 [Sesamum latifolium]|uniref:DUF4218 domain-containing protein n=1 Tax=Sesamum latifolium TaxID=2727402 RepID=A0AAW2WWB0_9LAMI
MSKAVYTLTREQKRRIYEWITRLKFPDGYASNLAHCVDMKELRLHGMKSHDCHVFMQKLISIAFREMLPESVWSALTEASLLFQIICSTTLDVDKVQELEDSVAIILWNLKKIFPPSFFNSMEHLIVHLSYEACWEGLYNTEAYFVEEIGLFTSQYFEPQVLCKQNRPGRNDDLAMNDTRNDLLKLHYWGPTAEVTTFSCYFVNCYNFHTESHSVGKATFNCRMCVKSSSYIDTDSDFYGILEEVIQLDYPLIPNMQIVLFKYRWVDPVRGMNVHPRYHLVDVNFKKVYQKNESFILAQQAVQVYYTEYSSMKRDKVDWLAVCRIKARRVVDDSCWTEVAFKKMRQYLLRKYWRTIIIMNCMIQMVYSLSLT